MLYVDDEPALLELTQIFLSDHVDMDIETDPLKVMGRLRSTPYDVMVSDYQMPGMDGIRLLKEIRAAGFDIPFILFTGKGREEVAIDALNNSATFYLQKGGDPAVQFGELCNAIVQLNRRKQVERSLVESEKRYRDVVENAQTIILKLSLDGKLTYMNQYGLNFFGISEAAAGLVAESIATQVVQSLNFVRGKLKDVLADPQRLSDRTVAHPLMLKDGRKVWVSWTITIIRDEQSEARELLVFGTDITPAKEAEIDLQRSISLTRASLDTSDEGILVVGNDLTILDHNLRYKEIWGITWEFKGKIDMGLVYSITREKIKDPESQIDFIEQCLREPDAERQRVLELVDGRVLEEYTTPFRIGNETVGRFWSYKDITNIRQAEREIVESEERLRSLSDNAFEGIIISNGGIIIDFNEALCNLTGYSPEELKGRAVLTLLTEDSRQIVREQTRKRSTDPFEVQIVRKDGRIIDVQVRDRFSTWKGKEARIGAVQDITERKRAEEQRSKLLEAIPDFVIVTDNEGIITFANRLTLEHSGYTMAELAGKNIAEFIAPEDVDKAVTNLRRMHGVQLGPVQYRLIMKDGRKVILEANGDIIRGTGGEPLGMVIIGRDISEHLRLESSLREANSKLRIMTSVTRHDTLNKLMVLRGLLELNRRRSKSPGMDESIDKMVRTVDLLVEQADFIKEYQNMGASNPEWQSVREVFERACCRFEHADVRFDNAADGLKVYADPMLEKVFSNLIDNSLKHGQSVKNVRIGWKAVDREVVITYRDDGVGINAGQRKHLFEEGYGQDHGLGLYLAKEILAITGISISEKGDHSGARFEIVVPSGSFVIDLPKGSGA